jgi:hypothetical protein
VNHSKRFDIRMTPEEIKMIRALAAAEGVTGADIVRRQIQLLYREYLLSLPPLKAKAKRSRRSPRSPRLASRPRVVA